MLIILVKLNNLNIILIFDRPNILNMKSFFLATSQCFCNVDDEFDYEDHSCCRLHFSDILDHNRSHQVIKNHSRAQRIEKDHLTRSALKHTENSDFVTIFENFQQVMIISVMSGLWQF